MSTSVSFKSGGTDIPAELYDVGEASNRAMVVIAYGVDGLIDNQRGPWETMIRGYADALSRKGFVVLIPHYLSKTGTPPGAAALDTIGLHRDQWKTAIADAVTYVTALPRVDASRIGLLGFSLGGNLCLQLRAMAKVLVEFFAPKDFLVGSPTPLTLRAQIHHGEADNLVFFDSNADDIKKLLQDEGADIELFPYRGANHGFVGSDPDNTKARNDSMERTVAFFGEHL